jgi:hypothetical protein
MVTLWLLLGDGVRSEGLWVAVEPPSPPSEDYYTLTE